MHAIITCHNPLKKHVLIYKLNISLFKFQKFSIAPQTFLPIALHLKTHDKHQVVYTTKFVEKPMPIFFI